jgi:hypothetical protein
MHPTLARALLPLSSAAPTPQRCFQARLTMCQLRQPLRRKTQKPLPPLLLLLLQQRL